MYARKIEISIAILVILLVVSGLAFALGASLAVSHSATTAEARAIQGWEYLKYEVSTMAAMLLLDETSGITDLDEAFEMASQLLDDLGTVGWELVDVEYYEIGSATWGYTFNEVFFFKRPR